MNVTWEGLERPLAMAISQKDLAVVKLLLRKGATVESRSSEGETPLFRASAQGVEYVELLIAHKARVNVQSNRGTTPLHIAAMSGDPLVIKALVKAGASINARDRQGRTPYGSARFVESILTEVKELRRLRTNEAVLKKLGGTL